MLTINPTKDIIVVFGPTASGKTLLGIEIAKNLNGSIINADSAQVYKEFPILTNIPTLEEQNNIDHYLLKEISICSNNFSVNDWLLKAKNAVEDIRKKNKLPIFIGGTGLYIHSLINGLIDIPSNIINKNKSIETYESLGAEKFIKLVKEVDPLFVQKYQDKNRLIRCYEVYLNTKTPLSKLLLQTPKRHIDANFIQIYLAPKREHLYNKINQRTLNMIHKGVIEEIREYYTIIKTTNSFNKIIGLKEITRYIEQEICYNSMVSMFQQRTRNYAKKQFTWFNNKSIPLFVINDTNNFIVKKVFKI